MSTLEIDSFTEHALPSRLRQVTSPSRGPRNQGDRVIQTVSPNIPYSVTAFVGDQRRLLDRTGLGAAGFPETVELIDGRLVVVHPRLRLGPNLTELRESFVCKYGFLDEKAYRSRFVLVLRFLAALQPELVKNALAQGHEPIAVREEFLSFLLNYRLRKQQKEIPQGAVRSFLDVWSHRWL